MIKSVLRNWYRYVLWTLISAVFWSWIFTLLFSAPVKKKVVLYADLPSIDDRGLSIALEEDLPEGIRRVPTNCFEDLMFDQNAVLHGDLYLIPESHAETYLDSFAPIDPANFPDASFYESDGEAYGILVYDESTGLKIAGKYVYYLPGERCWLFFNRDSVHLGTGDRAADDAAITVAQHFLNLP